ncbi:Linear gramicidin synthase subunit B [Arsenophonus endosymbiont of Aleurodicus floccissimus]|nr:Linear gramicidin synthase subunit B [Arsenophonus endosymbiont of Aleurodicus floccissimus]
MEDVAPALVLTSSVVNCALPRTTRCIDHSQLPEASPISTFLGYHLTPQACACLFYTSGTTGKPKAVAISQQGILHMAWQPDYVTIAPGQGVGSLSIPAFDAFSFDFWAVLTNGAYTVMITPDMLCYQGTDSDFKPAAPVDVLFYHLCTISLLSRWYRPFAGLDKLLISRRRNIKTESGLPVLPSVYAKFTSAGLWTDGMQPFLLLPGQFRRIS